MIVKVDNSQVIIATRRGIDENNDRVTTNYKPAYKNDNMIIIWLKVLKKKRNKADGRDLYELIIGIYREQKLFRSSEMMSSNNNSVFSICKKKKKK